MVNYFSCLLLIFCIAGNTFAAVVKGARIWPSPDYTRLVLDIDKKFRHKVFSMTNPGRIVIDLYDSKINTDISSLKLGNTGIKSIRTGKHNNKSRLVIELSKKHTVKYFFLKANNIYGRRFVIDLYPIQTQKTLSLRKPLIQKNKFIVAIDAGHGGEDPGAIGPMGTREKDVSLKIAKYLTANINKQKNMQAVMIRKGDYYLGLRERMQVARNNKADLFLSIHADAFVNPKSDGASVFILSDKHASSSAAKWLATRENNSDLIGGVRLDNKSKELASILLDLSRAANEKASLLAANFVLDKLGRNVKLHKGHVERAGFAVLKSLDMPSMLIESGFITNPATEKKLRTTRYQNFIANSVCSGVVEYYSKYGKKYK